MVFKHKSCDYYSEMNKVQVKKNPLSREEICMSSYEVLWSLYKGECPVLLFTAVVPTTVVLHNTSRILRIHTNKTPHLATRGRA